MSILISGYKGNIVCTRALHFQVNLNHNLKHLEHSRVVVQIISKSTAKSNRHVEHEHAMKQKHKHHVHCMFNLYSLLELGTD